jgi:hypothetical protein
MLGQLHSAHSLADLLPRHAVDAIVLKYMPGYGKYICYQALDTLQIQLYVTPASKSGPSTTLTPAPAVTIYSGWALAANILYTLRSRACYPSRLSLPLEGSVSCPRRVRPRSAATTVAINISLAPVWIGARLCGPGLHPTVSAAPSYAPPYPGFRPVRLALSRRGDLVRI